MPVTIPMTWVWVGAIVVFLLLEAAAPGLVCIWFAAGSLAAMICAALHGPLWLQMLWFLVISTVALLSIRPLMKRFTNRKGVATNADRNIGRTAVVKERIDNLAATGAVQLDGVVWTARSTDGSVLEPGEAVTVRAIEGVKLLVEASDRTDETDGAELTR